MAERKTTPEERRRYIEQQRADKKYIGGRHNVHSMDTSFIDRQGNIVRPTRDNPFPKPSYQKPKIGRAHV